jgi:hypothetical protein
MGVLGSGTTQGATIATAECDLPFTVQVTQSASYIVDVPDHQPVMATNASATVEVRMGSN